VKILADARCGEHPGRSIGVVVLSDGGFPSWKSRAAYGGRSARSLDDGWGDDPDSYFVSLRETSLTEVEGWCRDCRQPRSVAVANLLAAVASERRSVVLT
jgi:hypothetical protein